MEPGRVESVHSDMTGWLVLGGVLVAGFAFLSLLFAFVLFLLKAVFWLVLLPLRLIGWALGAVVLMVATVVAILFGLVMLLAPLVPLAIVVGIIYGIYRIARRPAAAPASSRV